MSWSAQESKSLLAIIVFAWICLLFAFWVNGGFHGSLIEWDIQPVRRVQHQIDINQATAKDFELLPGIGKVIAGRIVDSRKHEGRFHTIDQLDRVRGIGKKTIENLRRYLTVK